MRVHELEIIKVGSKAYITQPVTIMEADDGEHEERWLIAEGRVATPEIPESRAS